MMPNGNSGNEGNVSGSDEKLHLMVERSLKVSPQALDLLTEALAAENDDDLGSVKRDKKQQLQQVKLKDVLDRRRVRMYDQICEVFNVLRTVLSFSSLPYFNSNSSFILKWDSNSNLVVGGGNAG